MNKDTSSKLISFEELHKFSLENKDKLNRNIWTEEILKKDPKVINQKFLLMNLMEHKHAFGKKVEPHYRTMTHYEGNLLFQDLTKEQWNSLEEI
jgi:hypothetical protein|tara:strand:+ start:1226 stop:1507 length:282 start_codon:yes stop_codon:yes gene_type:complete